MHRTRRLAKSRQIELFALQYNLKVVLPVRSDSGNFNPHLRMVTKQSGCSAPKAS